MAPGCPISINEIFFFNGYRSFQLLGNTLAPSQAFAQYLIYSGVNPDLTLGRVPFKQIEPGFFIGNIAEIEKLFVSLT